MGFKEITLRESSHFKSSEKLSHFKSWVMKGFALQLFASFFREFFCLRFHRQLLSFPLLALCNRSGMFLVRGLIDFWSLRMFFTLRLKWSFSFKRYSKARLWEIFASAQFYLLPFRLNLVVGDDSSTNDLINRRKVKNTTIRRYLSMSGSHVKL